MGRHTSDSQWHFFGSAVAWAMPWVIVGAVIIGTVVVAVNALDPGPDLTSKKERTAPSGVERHTPVPQESPDEPGPSPSPGESAGDEKDGARDEKEEPDGLITSGITVQVLNATGGVEGAAAAMADRLAQLGYGIVAIDTALGNYENTIVYWSTDASRPAAQSLAAHFGWIAEPRPANLSTAVDIHVVVGLDEV